MRWDYTLTIGLLIVVCAVTASGDEAQRNARGSATQTSVAVSSGPHLRQALATDSVYTVFDCFGHLGLDPIPMGSGGVWDTLTELLSFSAPRQTAIEYLNGGGILVGGVVDGDTLVTQASELELSDYGEFLPPAFQRYNWKGDIATFAGPADYNYWSHYTDTIHSNIFRAPDFSGAAFKPLHVSVVLKTYAWQSGAAARCILHDFTVTNIGASSIRDCYIGVLLDTDVRSPMDTDVYFSLDDMVGSLPEHNICYAIDNDGDPQGGMFPSDTSPSRALGFKLLESWPVPRDTGFNWGVVVRDYWRPLWSFGPRRRGDDRWLGLDGSGRWRGNANLYHIMSTPGWDYDQVCTGTISPTDTIWQYPGIDSIVNCWAGGDTRFLYSFGPFQLQADSSVRFIITLFTTEQLHSDPHIIDYIPYEPELYKASLGLERLVTTAHVADSLAGLLTVPWYEPTGFRVTRAEGDSAQVEWDPWVLDNFDGANVYISEIPRSAYRHEGMRPVWYHSDSLPEPIEIDREHRYTFRGLNGGTGYICRVAHRYDDTVSVVSPPATIWFPWVPPAPQITHQYCYVDTTPRTTVRWTYPDSESVLRYRIYRFPDSVAATQKFEPFYDTLRLERPIVDSFDVEGVRYFLYSPPLYATVDAPSGSFTDTSACGGCVYVVTAIDTNFRESAFSLPVYTKQLAARTKDILVLTHAGGANSFVSGDTLAAFYQELLAGYDYDVFDYADSLATDECDDITRYCLNWYDFTKYEMVIVDDGLRDGILTSAYEGTVHGFMHYVASGGCLAYFGSLANASQPPSLIARPAMYARALSFARQYLGVDSAFYVGLSYYRLYADTPYVDTLCGFMAAEPTSTDLPALAFDTDRYPFTADLAAYWPEESPPFATAFATGPNTSVTHLFRSRYPLTSGAEGRPVGVRTNFQNSRAFAFGFHLWYMRPADARRLVDWLMQQLPTDVTEPDENATVPSLALTQNYPNPFNAQTQITFSLPEACHATLDVFNILGQKVKRLIDGEQSGGQHTVVWDGTNERGEEVSSGIYLYRLQTSRAALVRKMLLLK